MPFRTTSISNLEGASSKSGSRRNGLRVMRLERSPDLNDVRTILRISSMTRSRFVLPDALAPNTPAAGKTRTEGLPPSCQGTLRGTPSSAMAVASSESSNGSRKERTFSARNASSIVRASVSSADDMATIIAENLRFIKVASSAGSTLVIFLPQTCSVLRQLPCVVIAYCARVQHDCAAVVSSPGDRSRPRQVAYLRA